MNRRKQRKFIFIAQIYLKLYVMNRHGHVKYIGEE